MEALEEVVDNASDAMVEALMTADAKTAASQVALRFGLSGLGLGLAIGGGIGYFVTRRRLFKKFSAEAEEEIAQMREHFRAKEEARAAKPALAKLVEEKQYGEPIPAGTPSDQIVVKNIREATNQEVEPQEETTNVFDTAKANATIDVEDPWDYAVETRGRSVAVPYVIHIDERPDKPWDETVLTYFAGDNVLCNEQDQIMDRDDRERIVGEQNLERFGHGSGDANTVFIRNDYLEVDFEVVRSDGTYGQEVAGFEHAVTTRIPRRKQPYDDER